MENAIEYQDLSAGQQAAATLIFGQAKPLENYLYVVIGGEVQGWRYYKPSPACVSMINSLLDDKKSGYSGPTAAEVAKDADRADYDQQLADLRQF